MKNRYILVFSIIISVLIIDQATKLLVIRHIALHETIPVIPGFFNLTHARNTGAAFSLLSGLPAGFRFVFFGGVTLAALVIIGYMIRKTTARLQVVSLSLIAAGAVGNLIDRVRLGEVVDFIQWYYRSFAWPSFNIADSAISVGVTILAYDMLFGKHKEDVKS